jgi:hypothetical protein
MKPSVCAFICSGEAAQAASRRIAPPAMGRSRKSTGRRCPSPATRRASYYGGKKRRLLPRPQLLVRQPPPRLRLHRRVRRQSPQNLRRPNLLRNGRWRRQKSPLRLLRAGLFRSRGRSRALLSRLRHRFPRSQRNRRPGRLSHGLRCTPRALRLRLNLGCPVPRQPPRRYSSSLRFQRPRQHLQRLLKRLSPLRWSMPGHRLRRRRPRASSLHRPSHKLLMLECREDSLPRRRRVA